MIRSKQVTSNIDFWLSLVVHDTHDRSVLTLVYLLYVIAFFSVWTLAVMFLFSDLLVNTLSPLLASLGIAFADIIPILGMLLLALWSLYLIYKATNRSPLVFSEDDAHLLCQTPADRRFVTLTWFLSEWPSSALLFLAAAATVGFALLELDINNGIRVMSVGNLTVAALKPLWIIIPLHLGLFAVAWVIGVYRLQRDVKRLKIMRTLRILVVILVVTLFVVALGRILFPSYFTKFQPLLSFLTYPLDAAFLEGSWGLGLAVSFGLMTLSLAVLWQISDTLNLSRAAQETHHLQAQRVAFRIGDHDRIRELKDRERLGSMHVTSRIPTFPGAWMLTWKDVVQSQRTLAISRLWSWLVILLLTFSGTVAWVILEGSASIFVLIVYWTLLVSQQTSARFMKDLGNWWLVNSLPMSARRIIIHDVVRPVFTTIAITWIALGMSSLLGLSISPIIVCSVPFVVVGISFSSVFDMLRQADVGMLLVGRPPSIGLVGLAISMFCIAIPSAVYFLTENYSLSPIAGMLAIVLAGVSLAILLLRLSERQFRLVG
ncbi:MAG: hypothetical protein U9N80_06680 [Chloroflexota bacterium]|nr:hypothetical protein [Chloroflexota bacterium]